MQDDGGAESPWLKHKREMEPRVALVLLQNGVDLHEFSRTQIAAIEDASVEILLNNSGRRLDQVSVLTWVALMLFGVSRSMNADSETRKNARKALTILIKPVHEEVDGGVATYLARVLWSR